MKYRTIVADPPWAYNTTRAQLRSGGRGAQAEHHYDTMTMRDLAALPILEMAAEDAHLYLWVTNPRLYGDWKTDGPFTPRDIMEAWGFSYVTMLTWHKLGAPGMGWYFRGDTEHVLFGMRGRLGIPVEARVSNHFSAPKHGHSEKPEAFLDLVEQVSPGPYLELFARRQRFGWDTWGNECFNHTDMAELVTSVEVQGGERE